jgi:phosphoglycolate phosphatase
MATICLFDLDGTLLDSREPILRSLNRALASCDLEPIAGEDLWRHVGPPLETTLVSLLVDRGEDPRRVRSLIDAYRNEYRTISLDLAITYPGITALLDSMETRVRLGVVTSKPSAFARPIIETLELTSRFEIVEGPGDTELEPKPTTLERALTKLGVHPVTHAVTMIGDRHHDIEAGRALGTRTIGVTWGFGDRGELEAAGADAVADRPGQILEIIGPPES